jgi:YD repeat-containing protein
MCDRLPDGIVTTLAYAAAHRLTDIVQQDGSRLSMEKM